MLVTKTITLEANIKIMQTHKMNFNNNIGTEYIFPI